MLDQECAAKLQDPKKVPYSKNVLTINGDLQNRLFPFCQSED
jgi:hypothetical protein